jgi:hypothetical protein
MHWVSIDGKEMFLTEVGLMKQVAALGILHTTFRICLVRTIGKNLVSRTPLHEHP